MKICILCIGKIKDRFNREIIENLEEKINRTNYSFEILEYPDIKIPERMKEDGIELLIQKEWEKASKKISNKDYVIALCIEGKEITTKQHIEYVRKAKEQEYDSIVYLIGGSLGLPKELKERANLKLSFSKMTFPHQLMRMVLCEEIYSIVKCL